MHFLPISDNNILESAQNSAAAYNKVQGSDFADVFADHMAEENSELAAKTSAPDLAQDYNLSRDDVMGALDELSKEGVSEDRLNRLQELLNSNESITPHKISEALRQEQIKTADGKPAFPLSESDRQELSLFLRKIGFSEDKTADALAQLEGGGDVRVWAAMAQNLNMMDPKDPIGVSKSELDALGRGFRLNSGQRDMMGKMFGEADQELNPENLKASLSVLSKEMAKRNESDAKLTQALEDSFSKIRQSVIERGKIEQAADNRGSKEALQKEALFKDSATAKADGMAPAPAKGHDKDGVKDFAHSAAQKAEDVAREAVIREQSQAAKLHAQGQNQSARDLADNEPGFKQDGRSSAENGKQRANADALNGSARASDKQNAASHVDNFTGRADFAAQMNLNQPAHNAPQHGQSAQNANFSQQVFSQVENGLLRNLADGTKQLTIQLNPENLGTINVLLSVKNKELTAIIRPEDPETAKAIENQLHTLRLSLEQQGLKVERLEVRPQLQDSTSQTWQGFEQNLGGEAHKRSEEDRLADLFRGRPANLEENDTDIDPIATPRHTGGQSAGLDIMA